MLLTIWAQTALHCGESGCTDRRGCNEGIGVLLACDPGTQAVLLAGQPGCFAVPLGCADVGA